MKKFFIVLFLLISISLSATTYYIDPAGSDATGTGTSGNPWKSLYKACSSVSGTGDIIHVNAGTYTETQHCHLAVNVSIEGEGVTSHIISHYANSGGYEGLIQLIGETNTAQHISGIKLDGDSYQGYKAIGVYQRSNVSIHDITVVDFLIEGIRFGGTGTTTGNSVYNCIITNSGWYYGGDQRPNLAMTNTDGMLIYGNTITMTERGDGYSGTAIESFGGLTNFEIYDNTITAVPQIGEQWSFSFELWDCSDGEIYDNIITGAIDIAGNTSISGLDFHDNTVGWNTLQTVYNDGIQFENRAITHDITVRNNTFKNLERPIYFCNYNAASSYVEDVWIYNNIIYNVGRSGAHTGYGMFFETGPTLPDHYDNLNIWNNTILGSSTDEPLAGIFLPTGDEVTNISIRNNIIQGFNTAPIYANQSAYGTIDIMSVENNLFFGNGHSNTPYYVHPTPTNVTYQNNVINDNPDFVSSTDFHLQTSSPAIGRGIYVGLNTDKDGVAWKNPPSIGAYEYIGEDHPPSIQEQGFQMNENSPDGTAVGIVVASDPDAAQTLTYSIVSGNNNGAFAINALTGVLSVANSTALTVDFSLVVKVQDNGDGELSSQATIVINIIPTGFELTGNNGAIKVYPNPVSDELIIEIEGNIDRQRCEILNSIGQIVFRGNLAEKTVVQTTNFSPGIYLMKIENSKSFEFKKIVKV